MSNSYFVMKPNHEQSYIAADGFNVDYKDGSLTFWKRVTGENYVDNQAFKMFGKGEWSSITIYAPRAEVVTEDDGPEWEDLPPVTTFRTYSEKSWDDRNATWQEKEGSYGQKYKQRWVDDEDDELTAAYEAEDRATEDAEKLADELKAEDDQTVIPSVADVLSANLERTSAELKKILEARNRDLNKYLEQIRRAWNS